MQKNAWWLVPAVSLGVFACKEKPKNTESGDEDQSIVEKVLETVEEVVTPKSDPLEAKLSDEERAAKLGFAQYLPKDTQVVVSAYNAKQAAEQLKALELYGLIEGNLGMGNAMLEEDHIEEPMVEDAMVDPMIEEEILEEDEIEAPDAEQMENEMEIAPAQEGQPSPWMLLGQEVTLAFGSTTSAEAGNALIFNRRMAYFQAVALGKAALSFAETKSPGAFEESIGNSFGSEELVKSLLNDPESGLKLLKEVDMPTLYMAFRAKDGEVEQAAQLVNSGMGMFAMAGEMVAPVEFETGGSTFSGYQVLGEKIAEVMEGERESMEKDLSAEDITELLDIIRSKKLTIVTGTVGNYVVAMIGGNQDKLALSSGVKDSLVASGELNFVDAYADKQLVSLIYGDDELAKTLIDESGGLATYALGLRDGIAGGTSLGDTRDLQAMFQIIADREEALLDLGSYDDLGLVAFVDNGLKIESFGGYDKGAVDWKKSTTLSHLGDSGSNLLFLNVPGDAKYDEKLGEYAEALLETAYAVTMKVSELDIDDRDFVEMKQYAQLFDAQFREDVVGIYEAISGDLAQGLGDEYAVVVDLEGAFPAVPGVPQAVINDAKAPRLTMIAPVEDREKLASAWTKIDGRATSLLAKASEMTGKNIPMQKPMSSEKDGMTTWFFPLPFFQDDFMPSVTVSDEWFAASSSKTRAIDLIGKASAGGVEGNGIKFYVNFNTLTNYADEMMTMVENNADDLFPNEFQLRNFNRNKKDIKEIIAASKDFDTLDWTIRKEDGLLRSSIHFKMK